MGDYAEYLREIATEEGLVQFSNERVNICNQIRQFLHTETVLTSNSDREKEVPLQAVPQTFAIWSSEQSSPEALSAEEHFCRDIEEYEHSYLGQGDFHARYLHEFRDAIARLRQQEIDTFLYTPLIRPGALRMSFVDFMISSRSSMRQDPEFSDHLSKWDIHCIAIRRYETYLETPEHIAHFHRARNFWAELDRRELQGLPRDPLAETLQSMQRDLDQIQDALTYIRGMMDIDAPYMTHAERERVRDSIAELERAEELIRECILHRGVPTEFQREEIRMTLCDASATTIDTAAAVYNAILNGEHYPLTPPPTQTSFRTQMEETPASVLSDCDTEYRMIELRAMMEYASEGEYDAPSTVMDDDRGEESSDADSDLWFSDNMSEHTEEEEA